MSAVSNSATIAAIRERYDDYQARSPMTQGPTFSALADANELVYREEIERIDDPVADTIGWIERKELPHLLSDALLRTGVRPKGTVVDLGAGTCWMASLLARQEAVERVIAVEFSRRRLESCGPAAMAYLDAPAEKIHRLHADFYNHGLGEGIADLVATDASYHHAVEPRRLARVALDLLKPGGVLLLHREPTLSLLRRTRDHGEEGNHGDFEHEYFARQYIEQLLGAGFERAEKFDASIGTSPVRRALLKPPLVWLNGVIRGSYTYVAHKATGRG